MIWETRVRISQGTALSVDAQALNNEASVHAYNLRERERGSHFLIAQVKQLLQAIKCRAEFMSFLVKKRTPIFFKKLFDRLLII